MESGDERSETVRDDTPTKNELRLGGDDSGSSSTFQQIISNQSSGVRDDTMGFNVSSETESQAFRDKVRTEN